MERDFGTKKRISCYESLVRELGYAGRSQKGGRKGSKGERPLQKNWLSGQKYGLEILKIYIYMVLL